MGLHPRGASRPSFVSSPHPQVKEGAGKTGRRLAPAVRCAQIARRRMHSGIQGSLDIPAFPAQWFDGLWRALPGERCTIAPVALRMTDALARSGRHITARLGAQTPGARTTRFCCTPITPVVCALGLAHGCPPCKTLRADVTCVHRRPARVRDDRDTPLFLGPGCGDIYAVSEFRQSGIFSVRRIDRYLGCLPDGKRKVS